MESPLCQHWGSDGLSVALVGSGSLLVLDQAVSGSRSGRKPPLPAGGPLGRRQPPRFRPLRACKSRRFGRRTHSHHHEAPPWARAPRLVNSLEDLAGRRPRIGSHERARGPYVDRPRGHGRRADTKGEAGGGRADRPPLESERVICEDHGASRPAEGAGRAGDGRFQDGQLVGCGSSIFLWAPCGRSCTAIVSAGMLLSFRSMCTSLPPASTNPCPAVYGWLVQVGSSPM